MSRVLRRHQLPALAPLEPITGDFIRASKTTAVRSETDSPGELAHMDAKKIGETPDDGGRRADGRAVTSGQKHKRVKIGCDDVRSLIDDHSRLAYSEVFVDKKERPALDSSNARRPTSPTTASPGCSG